MSCDVESKPIDINDLEVMLQEAKKGRAKVDKQYVEYEDKGQLFEYDINFSVFLEDVDFLFQAVKERENNG